MHYFQFNIGDYMKHTARLTLMEDLAYRRMLDLYYLNDGPLCSDTKRLAKQIGMAGEEDAIAFVLSEFFTLDGDAYRNSRADKEIASYAEKAEKSRLNGRKGGRPRTGQQPSNNPEETQQVISGNPEESERKGNHKPLTNNQEPVTKKPKEKTVSPSLDYSCWPSMPNDELFAEWKELRKRKKAAISQTVINRVGKELHKAASSGFTVDKCFEQWIYKGWSGFEAEWMSNSGVKKPSQMQPITGITYQEMDL